MQTWTLMTHWKFSPQPFSSQGYRQQATIKIVDVPGRPGYYYTETQVKRQVNDNMLQPSKLSMAKWGDESRCGELENLISRRIEMYFLQSGYSDNFCQRYGVPDDSRRIDCSEIDRNPQRPEPQYAGPRPGGACRCPGAARRSTSGDSRPTARRSCAARSSGR